MAAIDMVIMFMMLKKYLFLLNIYTYLYPDNDDSVIKLAFSLFQ